MTKTTANILLIAIAFLFAVTGAVMLMVPKLQPVDIAISQIPKIKEKVPEIVTEKFTEAVKDKFPLPPIKMVPPNPRDILTKDLHEVDYNTVIPKVSNWAYVIKNPSLEDLKKSNIDLIVVDTEIKTRELNKNDVTSLKTKPNGSKRYVLAYLSLGMAEDYRSYWKEDWAKTAPVWLGQKHKIWKGTYYIKDVMAPEWTEIAMKMVDSVLEKGYDGVLVDGLGNITDQFKAKEFVSMVAKRLKDTDSNKLLIAQDVDSFLKNKDIVSNIDGVVRQGLVYSPLSNGIRGKKNDPQIISDSAANLKEFASKNKLVFVVEYVSGKQWSDAKEILTDYPFVIYSAPLELDKLRKQQ